MLSFSFTVVSITLAEARQKRIVHKAGEFEVDFIDDRRPELYGKVTEVRGTEPSS